MTQGVSARPQRLRWYDGLEPVTASIRCRGELHSVTWRAGRLMLHDHDLAAEAALGGLGGETCPCVDVVDLCRYDVASLGPFPLWTADADMGGGGARFNELSPRRADRRLDLLRALPVPFRRRLALGGFVAVSRGDAPVEPWANPPFAWVFGRLLSDAAAATARAARPDLDPGPVDVRWVGIPPGRHPRAEGRLGPRVRTLRVELSPRWVADVWAHGRAVEGDALVLAPMSGCRYLAVRWSAPDSRGRSAAYLAVEGR